MEEIPVSFVLYIIGFLVFIGGVAWALITAGVSQHWVIIISIILLGLGILTGATRTREKDENS